MYGNKCKYVLGNSEVCLNLANFSTKDSTFTKHEPHYKGETVGMIPDFWMTNDQILPSLVKLTGDGELFEVLNGLDKAQI